MIRLESEGGYPQTKAVREERINTALKAISAWHTAKVVKILEGLLKDYELHCGSLVYLVQQEISKLTPHEKRGE